MDDLIKRQDAIRAVTTRDWCGRCEKAIKNIPSVDAVEVVRCYKCIHWDEDTVRRNSNDATWWNEAVCRKYSDDIWDVWKDADWFCADGERKTDV